MLDNPTPQDFLALALLFVGSVNLMAGLGLYMLGMPLVGSLCMAGAAACGLTIHHMLKDTP